MAIENLYSNNLHDFPEDVYAFENTVSSNTEKQNQKQEINDLYNFPEEVYSIEETIKQNFEKQKVNPEIITKLQNKLRDIKDKEISQAPVITQIQNFINKEVKEETKSTKDKQEKSLFKKIGGWETIGNFFGYSLLLFVILALLGEFKLLQKSADINLGGAVKGGKK